MPELPEVETIVRGLSKLILGLKIKKAMVFYPAIVSGNKTLTILQGDSFKKIERHGKYIKITTTAGLRLLVHLRMTGQFFIAPKNYQPDKHVHIILELSDLRKIIYRDIRKFGRWTFVPKQQSFENYINAGEDALTITPERLGDLVAQNKKKMLKAFLLDQTKIAGIGNIYADEICFRVGLQPEILLAKVDHLKLHKLIRQVLLSSIKNQGTSFSDYRTASGEKGNFQNMLNVYQQKACKLCGGKITRTVVAGRSTHYCQNCQKI